jgi:hypothetical protein
MRRRDSSANRVVDADALRPDSVLSRAPVDPKGLPLDAFEAFALSQMDGRSTLAEVAEVVGVEYAKVAALARRLLTLGALAPPSAISRRRPRPEEVMSSGVYSSRASREEPFAAPRKERQRKASSSLRAPPRPAESHRPHRSAESPRPPRPAERAPTPGPPAAARPPRSADVVQAPPVSDDVCDLDEATYGKIMALDATLVTLDHYALFGIDRGANESAVKRAYFATAATFHPDRFFGKKLGRARSPLTRIFARLSEANETLSDRARRAAYDMTLPKAPVSEPPRAPDRASKAPPKAPSMSPPVKRPSRSMRKSSKAMRAIAPAPAVTSALAFKPPTASPTPPPPVAAPPPPPPAPRKSRSIKAVRAGVRQKHVVVFLQAAEEAMKLDDVVTAANNYRLALQIDDDPWIRDRLAAVDGLAKGRRRERSIARARIAEREERWADAATHFSLAHDAVPDAPTAERAAHSLRKSQGDLHRAAALAEYAVSQQPNNAGYRVTLAEIYVAANLPDRARAESVRAVELAPDDERAARLVAALKKKA